ncbi:hypothetical protein NL676_010908 [Syzygium grande]|nr:hypothetical protein NL676_010908 [Syzygium grande]
MTHTHKAIAAMQTTSNENVQKIRIKLGGVCKDFIVLVLDRRTRAGTKASEGLVIPSLEYLLTRAVVPLPIQAPIVDPGPDGVSAGLTRGDGVERDFRFNARVLVKSGRRSGRCSRKRGGARKMEIVTPRTSRCATSLAEVDLCATSGPDVARPTPNM